VAKSKVIETAEAQPAVPEAPVEASTPDPLDNLPVIPTEPVEDLDGPDDLLEAVEYTEKSAKGERVLDQHRLAFEVHKARLEAKAPMKAIQFLPQSKSVNFLRFKVGQGEVLSEFETAKVFAELKEFIAEGEFIFAASAVDILLASDKIERQG